VVSFRSQVRKGFTDFILLVPFPGTIRKLVNEVYNSGTHASSEQHNFLQCKCLMIVAFDSPL
jgi:hypothetical protein